MALHGFITVGPWLATQLAFVSLRDSQKGTLAPRRILRLVSNTFLLPPRQLPTLALFAGRELPIYFSFENTRFITVVDTCCF